MPHGPTGNRVHHEPQPVARASTEPGPHPSPLRDIAERRLTILTTSQPWYRLHKRARAPLFYGRSRQNRFDAPGGEYGVLYAGADAHCAFIETFGHTTGGRLISVHQLDLRLLTELQVTAPLRLADLTGTGLARLGADERLCAGDYSDSQEWSGALYDHPERPDGLVYRSRHDPSRICVAIYERAAPSLQVAGSTSLTAPGGQILFNSFLSAYDFGLLYTE